MQLYYRWSYNRIIQQSHVTRLLHGSNKTYSHSTVSKFIPFFYFNNFLPTNMTTQAPTTDVMMLPIMLEAWNPMMLNKKLPTKPPIRPRIMFLISPPLLPIMAPAMHPDIAPTIIPAIIPMTSSHDMYYK